MKTVYKHGVELTFDDEDPNNTIPDVVEEKSEFKAWDKPFKEHPKFEQFKRDRYNGVIIGFVISILISFAFFLLIRKLYIEMIPHSINPWILPSEEFENFSLNFLYLSVFSLVFVATTMNIFIQLFSIMKFDKVIKNGKLLINLPCTVIRMKGIFSNDKAKVISEYIDEDNNKLVFKVTIYYKPDLKD